MSMDGHFCKGCGEFHCTKVHGDTPLTEEEMLERLKGTKICPRCRKPTLREDNLPGPGRMVGDDGERIPDRGTRCTNCGFTKFDLSATLP